LVLESQRREARGLKRLRPAPKARATQALTQPIRPAIKANSAQAHTLSSQPDKGQQEQAAKAIVSFQEKIAARANISFDEAMAGEQYLMAAWQDD
jgi:hypothetical protein